MSGLDYGARAYKNGKPRPDRINASVIVPPEERRRARKIPHAVVESPGVVAGDAVLGDGPVYVTFTKCTARVWYGDACVLETNSDADRLIGAHSITVRPSAGGHVYVELRHEDGTAWHGFGGYGPPVAECEAHMRTLWPGATWRVD